MLYIELFKYEANDEKKIHLVPLAKTANIWGGGIFCVLSGESRCRVVRIFASFRRHCRHYTRHASAGYAGGVVADDGEWVVRDGGE